MLPLKPFYLVRHGQSKANVEKIMAGCGVDSPCLQSIRHAAGWFPVFVCDRVVAGVGLASGSFACESSV